MCNQKLYSRNSVLEELTTISGIPLNLLRRNLKIDILEIFFYEII